MLKKLQVICPQIEQQNKFADFVQQIDKSKYIVQQRKIKYQELLTKKMDEYFSYRTFDKPDKAYHRIEDGGKTISMGIFTYWNVSHLGYGWYDLLKPGEDLFCNSRR